MSYLNNIAAIVEAISQQWEEIEMRVGDKWPELERKLLAVLQDLADAADETQAKELITEVLFLGYYTPASSLFRKILQAYPLDGGLVEVSRLGDRFTTHGEKSVESAAVEETVTLASLKAGIVETITQLQSKTIQVGGDVPIPRYLNAGFFTENGEYIGSNIPLTLDKNPYKLVVNIGPFWGPGTPDQSFPDTLLEPHYQEDTVELLVVVNAHDISMSPAFQSLTLPRHGASTPVEFQLTLKRTGLHAITVDILYYGHLLQSRRLTFKVTHSAAEQLPPSAWPVQDGYTTFTRTSALEVETLQLLDSQPRALTIVAEREPTLNLIGLRFYNQQGDNLAFAMTDLGEAALASGMAAIRARLLAMMKASAESNDEMTSKVLVAHLGKLANYGRTLYSQLLPDLSVSDTLQAELKPDAVIQIAPLSARLSVPWETLYERPIHSYHPDRTKLCDTFQTHGPDPSDCPHYGNGHVVCPHGFWGFRYVIEQLPGRLVHGQQPTKSTVPQWIRNNQPLDFAGLVFPGFGRLPAHWQRLRTLADPNSMTMRQLDTYNKVSAFFGNKQERPHLVYFYAHGGEDGGRPYLSVANSDRITINDLESWGVNWHASEPLLIINACDSAAYSPDTFEDLVQAFYRRGAAGIIGTQCTIYEGLVDTIMIPFLTSFLRQVPIGKALLAARRQLMWQRRDPRGLTYSLFAAGELKLAQAVVG